MQVQNPENIASHTVNTCPGEGYQKLVTVAVIPRERYSYAITSLNSILEATRRPLNLIYIDAGSPAHVGKQLEAKSKQVGFRLLRINRYLFPNQARNLAIDQVTTRYVVFIDNDVLVTDGWLDSLVSCAEETGASIVAPLYLEGELDNPTIHMAGANLRIEEVDGVRVMRNQMLHSGTFFRDLQVDLKRKQCTSCEFHCVLVRRDVFEQLGPLDLNLQNTREHLDLALGVRQAGGSIYFEPRSVVSYVPAERFALFDLPFFLFRWRESVALASLSYFEKKWRVAPKPISLELMRNRRKRMLDRFLPGPLKCLGHVLAPLIRYT